MLRLYEDLLYENQASGSTYCLWGNVYGMGGCRDVQQQMAVVRSSSDGPWIYVTDIRS